MGNKLDVSGTFPGYLQMSANRTTPTCGPVSASLTATRVQVDLGTTPIPEFTTTVTNATATAAHTVQAWISAATPTGKDADEVEMDVINVWGKAAAGSIDFRITGQTGHIHDKFYIDYLLIGVA